MTILRKNRYCIQCGKGIETSFQTKYCSRKCWEEYKKEHSLSVSSERQATIFLKASAMEEDRQSELDDDVRIVPLEKDWKSLPDKSKQFSLGDTAQQKERSRRGPASEGEKPADRTLRKEYVDFLKRRLTEKEKEVKQLTVKVHDLEEKLAEAQNKLISVDTAKMVPPLFEDDETVDEAGDEHTILDNEEDIDSIIPPKVSWWKRLLGR